MTDTLNPILQWLNTHPHWAGFATFVISACESIAIIGTIVPGTIMMTAIGALAGADVIPLWLTIFLAILGAILGDGISYFIGYHFKDRIRLVWPFKNNPEWLESGERFFKKHGGKSVFIGRFVGPVRAIIPVIAGMLSMKPAQFFSASIPAAIGWAPVYMLPGLLLGAVSLELPPDMAVHAILMLLLVFLFITLCVWVLIRILMMIGYNIDKTLNTCWRYLQGSRYSHSITYLLKHHDEHKTHGQLVLAFYFIFVVIAFCYIAHEVTLLGSSSIQLNNEFFHFFRGLRSSHFDPLMIRLTILGESNVLLPAVFIFLGGLFLTKRTYLAWHVLALCVLTIGSVELFKHVIASSRPWGIVESPSSYSFPSGHSVLATTFFMGLALLLAQSYPKRKISLIAIGLLIAFAISFSRLYLGVHWFTDVLAGWLLSAAILIAVTISYNRQKHISHHLAILASIAIIAFIGIGSIVNFHEFDRYQKDFTMLEYPSYPLTKNTWWKHTDKHLPIYRVNRFGWSDQVLNLQWAGDLDTINKILLANGWVTPPQRNWISVIQRISDVESTEHIPLVSPLYLDKKPVLVLIKHTQNKKNVLVLRLWDSNLIMQPTQEHLWVGTISLIPRTYSWILHKKPDEVIIDSTVLFTTQPKNLDVKTMILLPVQTHRHDKTPKIIILVKSKA